MNAPYARKGIVTRMGRAACQAARGAKRVEPGPKGGQTLHNIFFNNQIYIKYLFAFFHPVQKNMENIFKILRTSVSQKPPSFDPTGPPIYVVIIVMGF